jgi:hypothetical protein
MLLKVAGGVSALLGLGFGLPGVYGTWYFARHGEVWTFLGFPTYGKGPFQQRGIETTVALLVTFVVVCVAEVAVGWLLWQEMKVGAWVALALLPVELLFWFGFALPFGFVLGLARTVLVLAALVRWP